MTGNSNLSRRNWEVALLPHLQEQHGWTIIESSAVPMPEHDCAHMLGQKFVVLQGDHRGSECDRESFDPAEAEVNEPLIAYSTTLPGSSHQHNVPFMRS